MSSQAFDFQDLLQLVELMKSTSQFSEFKLRANGIELELRRGPPGAAPAAPVGAVDPSPAAPAPAAELARAPVAESTPTQPATRARPDVAAQDAVKAPMVGTVYLAPEPGAKPFVVVGQAVEADTQVCIVEVMKLMNSVAAGRKGIVGAILVDDGEGVEYGQPLFVITPA